MKHDGKGTERLIERACRPFRLHPEYDDLRQEARLAVWQLATTAPEKATPANKAQAARWAILHYLSGPRTIRGVRRSWREAGIQPAASLDGMDADRLPPVADFAPALLERLAQRAHWEAVQRVVTPRQWAAIALCYGEAISLREAADQLGITPSGVMENIRAGLARYRRHLGMTPATKVKGLPNAARTHCPQGHPLTGDNLYHWQGDNRRRCLTCHRNRGQRQRKQGCEKRNESVGSA